MELVEFLRARLDEDEQAARQKTSDVSARMLREVAEKRDLVERYEQGRAYSLERMRRALLVHASLYSGHPDYRQEWRA